MKIKFIAGILLQVFVVGTVPERMRKRFHGLGSPGTIHLPFARGATDYCPKRHGYGIPPLQWAATFYRLADLL